MLYSQNTVWCWCKREPNLILMYMLQMILHKCDAKVWASIYLHGLVSVCTRLVVNQFTSHSNGSGRSKPFEWRGLLVAPGGIKYLAYLLVMGSVSDAFQCPWCGRRAATHPTLWATPCALVLMIRVHPAYTNGYSRVEAGVSISRGHWTRSSAFDRFRLCSDLEIQRIRHGQRCQRICGTRSLCTCEL